MSSFCGCSIQVVPRDTGRHAGRKMDIHVHTTKQTDNTDRHDTDTESIHDI